MSWYTLLIPVSGSEDRRIRSLKPASAISHICDLPRLHEKYVAVSRLSLKIQFKRKRSNRNNYSISATAAATTISTTTITTATNITTAATTITIIITITSTITGWGAVSVSKLFPSQAGGPKIDPQNPCTKSGRDRQMDPLQLTSQLV